MRWACPRCETVNALDAPLCSVCGTSFADAVRDPEPPRPERDPGTSALISLFLPGAGHAYLGMWGQAVARAVISLWVVLTAVLGMTQGSVALAAVFGVVAVGLWVVAAHDAYREAQGDSGAALLRGRMFMYLVLGLLGILFVMLVAAALQTRAV